jgi:hypothetical protein
MNKYSFIDSIYVCVCVKVTFIYNKFSEIITKFEPSNDQVTKAVLLMVPCRELSFMERQIHSIIGLVSR